MKNMNAGDVRTEPRPEHTHHCEEIKMAGGAKRLLARKTRPQQHLAVIRELGYPRVGKVVEIVICEKALVCAAIRDEKQKHNRQCEYQQPNPSRCV